MALSISRQTIEVTLLLSYALLSLSFAGLFEQNNETVMNDETNSSLEQAASSKFRTLQGFEIFNSLFSIACIFIAHSELNGRNSSILSHNT